jgi:5-methylcytosine-specific restriction endonuclease McrA
MEQPFQETAEVRSKGDNRPLVARSNVHGVKKMARTVKRVGEPRQRDSLPLKTRVVVLTECGYRCAVPTCRNILALDMHHIWEVSAGGGDAPDNLIALCPTCHALYHRGTIRAESIYVYKAMLVAITRAFDLESIDRLLFLESCEENFLVVSGDGLLHFGRLVAAGLATVEQKANNNWQIVTYAVNISDKGRQMIDAWKQGDRAGVKEALGRPGCPAT